MVKLSIVGIVGLPAAYGGFETLVDNLVQFFQEKIPDFDTSVYCSGHKSKNCLYESANLKFIDLKANGVSSVLYDIVSLCSAVKNKSDVILVLGVSGAIFLPFVRMFTKSKIIVNIDGIESRRAKWGFIAKLFLEFSEFIAVKMSHSVIADNQEISNYVYEKYNAVSIVIPYGGDHAFNVKEELFVGDIPNNFSLSVCRIEPENNIGMILESFSLMPDHNLVLIGNWESSDFGNELYVNYSKYHNIYLLDPIYSTSLLKNIRGRCDYYVHGHSAGGTNPSLVEMMYFDVPIFCFDCKFNRYTTQDKALFFSTPERLCDLLIHPPEFNSNVLTKIASEQYNWHVVSDAYSSLIKSTLREK